MSGVEVFTLVKQYFFTPLIGKKVIVEIHRDHQPWLDEDFHMLHFIITHNENVEHITLHINEGFIKNVKYWEENLITLSN